MESRWRAVGEGHTCAQARAATSSSPLPHLALPLAALSLSRRVRGQSEKVRHAIYSRTCERESVNFPPPPSRFFLFLSFFFFFLTSY
jgi:hypothetical protein